MSDGRSGGDGRVKASSGMSGRSMVMDRQQITRELTTEYGSFVRVGEVAEYLRIDRGTARAILYGTPFLPNGRAKLYHVADVARAITERSKV